MAEIGYVVVLTDLKSNTAFCRRHFARELLVSSPKNIPLGVRFQP